MKGIALVFVIGSCLLGASTQSQPAIFHPNTADSGWYDLFQPDLSNAIFPPKIWTFESGILTASKDEAIWSKKAYANFILDLEFQNAKGTNSGVFVHASNIKDWTANCVEIQIADDFDPEWANSPPSWQCAAIFGHQPATQHLVKKPGEWNHYTISCIDKKIWVVLNGVLVNVCDMSLFTSSKTNPDGTAVPDWLSKPMSALVLEGRIGLQGKHAGAPIYFRHIRIKELPKQ
jgi:Domain of Unknown Function (DUF1080)